MSAWICNRSPSSEWTARQFNDSNNTAKGVNTLDLEKNIRKTAGFNIWAPLSTSWSMVTPTSAVYVMAVSTLHKTNDPAIHVETKRAVESETEDKHKEEIHEESDDEPGFGGLFD